MNKLIGILLFVSSTCIAQSTFKLYSTIATEADFFTTDNQCNIYVVKGTELIKYSKTGRLLYKYSNNNLWKIDFVDASNMLRLLVFYKNFSQFVFLDNTLSLIGEPVSLDKMGFQQTQLVCSSYDNSMWLYDQQNLELVRINKTFDKTQQTGNLNLLLNIDLKPDYLVEYDNKVYLNNPSSGIMLFDIYGTYFKTVPIKNINNFQPIADWIYYVLDQQVKAYNTKTTDEILIEMPVKEFRGFRMETGVLVVQTTKSISIYNIN